MVNGPKSGLGGPHRGVVVDQGQQVKGLAGVLPALGVGLVGEHDVASSEMGQLGSVGSTLATNTENAHPIGTGMGTLGDVGPSSALPSAVSGHSGGAEVTNSSLESPSRPGDRDGSQGVDPVSGTTVGTANGGPSELGQWKAMGIAVISITLLGTVMPVVMFFDKRWGFVCDVFGIQRRKGKALHGEEEEDRWEDQKVWVGSWSSGQAV